MNLKDEIKNVMVKRKEATLIPYEIANQHDLPGIDGRPDLSRSFQSEHSLLYQPDMKMFLSVKKSAEDIFNNGSLSDEVKAYYSKIFFKIDKEKIDLTNPEILKAYLALKKLVKYKGNVSLETKPGFFDEKSPFLGEYAIYHKQLKEKNSSDFLNFSAAFYSHDAVFSMIPQEDREKAELLGDQMLRDELTKYGAKPEEIFDAPMTDFRNVTVFNDTDNKWSNWNVQIVLSYEHSQKESKRYAPFGVIALHELGHVRQTMPGTSKKDYKNDQFDEIAPTIDLIVRQDEIYKTIHNIPLEQEVKYPKPVFIAGKSYNLGQIANRFRQIKNMYHFDNFEQVLLTKEADNYVRDLTSPNNSHVPLILAEGERL